MTNVIWWNIDFVNFKALQNYLLEHPNATFVTGVDTVDDLPDIADSAIDDHCWVAATGECYCCNGSSWLLVANVKPLDVNVVVEDALDAAPTYVWAILVDPSDGKIYISTATSASTDWTEVTIL